MKTATKQTAASKAFEATLRAMTDGAEMSYQRQACVITFTRSGAGVVFTFAGDPKTYWHSLRDAADWWTNDDGKGPWAKMS